MVTELQACGQSGVLMHPDYACWVVMVQSTACGVLWPLLWDQQFLLL